MEVKQLLYDYLSVVRKGPHDDVSRHSCEGLFGIVHKKRVLVDVSGQLYEISPISQGYAVVPTDEVIQLESEKFPDWNSVLEYVNAEEL